MKDKIMTEGKTSQLEPDFPVFADMLRKSLGERIPEGSTLPGMVSEDVEFEPPSAPDGPRRIVGRAGFAAHLREASETFTIERARARRVYHCKQPEAVIVEFDLSGHWLQGGAAFEQQGVAIIETADGHITRYREYVKLVPVSRLGAVN